MANQKTAETLETLKKFFSSSRFNDCAFDVEVRSDTCVTVSAFKDKEELLLEYDKRRMALQCTHRHKMQDLDRWYWSERDKLEHERRERDDST